VKSKHDPQLRKKSCTPEAWSGVDDSKRPEASPIFNFSLRPRNRPPCDVEEALTVTLHEWQWELVEGEVLWPPSGPNRHRPPTAQRPLAARTPARSRASTSEPPHKCAGVGTATPTEAPTEARVRARSEEGRIRVGADALRHGGGIKASWTLHAEAAGGCGAYGACPPLRAGMEVIRKIAPEREGGRERQGPRVLPHLTLAQSLPGLQ